MAQNFTEVRCSNCGAKVIIPANESVATGRIIGQDSGLGTIILPTEGDEANIPTAGYVATPKFDGKFSFDSAMEYLKNIAQSSPEVKAALMAVEKQMGKVANSGYLPVQIVRRWLVSQALEMVNSASGFHRSLLNRGYWYSVEVIVNDLKHQCHLQREHDEEGIKDRQRFYNADLLYMVIADYKEKLMAHVNEMPVHKCKRHKYIKIHMNGVNGGKGVFVDEIYKVLVQPLTKMLLDVKLPDTCDNVEKQYSIACRFKKFVDDVNWWGLKPSQEFVNTYKAAGAYYTMKDLILFENCLMKVDKRNDTEATRSWGTDNRHFVQQQESLQALEKRFNDMDILYCGYEGLGLLKDFLDYNNFDHKAAKLKWAEEAEKHREARKATKSRRYNK